MNEIVVRVFHQIQAIGLVFERVKKVDWGGFVWYWLPLSAYATAMIYLSSLSVPQKELVVLLDAVNSIIPAEGDVFSLVNDKFYHIIEYAVLAVLTFRAFRYSSNERTKISIGLMTIVAVVLFGCTDEIHQWFTPLRHTDGWDLVADTLGGIIGISFWQGALSIPFIRFLEERVPLKLQIALGVHVLRM